MLAELLEDESEEPRYCDKRDRDRLLTRVLFGRFDVRFVEFKSFTRGKGIIIVELNGDTSEPTHIWDVRTTLLEAYRTVGSFIHEAFESGAWNRARGKRTQSAIALLKSFRRELALRSHYPQFD